MTLFCTHKAFLLHLIQEHQWLKEQMERERQRAEMAIDELLRVRVQGTPVAQPSPQEKATIERLNAMVQDPEFNSVGSME